MKAELQSCSYSAFLLHPSCFDLSGRDSSWQNGDCLGSWSSKRRVGLTPRPDGPICFSLSSTLSGVLFESQRQAEAQMSDMLQLVVDPQRSPLRKSATS